MIELKCLTLTVVAAGKTWREDRDPQSSRSFKAVSQRTGFCYAVVKSPLRNQKVSDIPTAASSGTLSDSTDSMAIS